MRNKKYNNYAIGAVVSAALAMALSAVLLCGCRPGPAPAPPSAPPQSESRTAAPLPAGLSDADCVEILKLLAEEISSHRLSQAAESGRVIEMNVAAFKAYHIDDFVEWARRRFDTPPNHFAIITGDSPEPELSMEAARALVGSQPNDNALQQWTRYYFAAPLPAESGAAGQYMFEVGVSFPMGQLVGAGHAFVLEKQASGWTIVDTYETWIA